MNPNPTKKPPALSVASDDTLAAQTIAVSDSKSDSDALLGCTCWEDAVNVQPNPCSNYSLLTSDGL